MERGRLLGALLVAGAPVLLFLYAWLLFAPPREGLDLLVVKLSLFALVSAVLGLAAWVGYVLLRTRPPRPIEEVEAELEEELRRLEEQEKGQEP